MALSSENSSRLPTPIVTDDSDGETGGPQSAITTPDEDIPVPPGRSQSSRPISAIIVGAGIGGIATAVLLSHKVDNLTYTVYDRNSKVGGTWAENTYPGVRCDVPSHVYQLTFAPNTDWSEYYSKGSEIQEYYARVVEDYGVKPNLRLSHEVLSARWIADTREWDVEVRNLLTGEVFRNRADFLISAPGRVNEPHYPDIKDLATFKGKVVHTARWDSSIVLDNKRVAIIGNGASGQQILPNIVSQVAHIDHYVRSKTYVSPTFRQGLLEASAEIPGGLIYSEDEKRTFRENPAAYLAYRKGLDKQHYGAVNNQFGKLGTEANNKLRESLLSTMLQRLHGDKEWLARLTPDYAPGCKRLTPAPGYLEAIIGPKVEFIDDNIIEATEHGLKTGDGSVRNVDVIILATGFQNGFYPRFPTINKDGDDLSQIWRPGGKVGYPETYMGAMAPQTPNYFFVLQAQGNAFGGSVPYQCEISATYIAKVIRKIQRHQYATVSPTLAAASEFSEVVDRYFKDSVVNDGCRSYFKLGGHTGRARNVIGFPGTTRQRLEVLAEPRWEDFAFETLGGARIGSEDQHGTESGGDVVSVAGKAAKNRFLGFWGDGRSVLDEANDLDAVTYYLKEVGKVDLRRLHEDLV
ncbi:hypothetical protein Z517_02064 [Fonsecaea pedrosoi CBS 271.37]|uniref:L-ornithine N(5)-oxygenase n=1 Tax=Fonsecaea pedrosoi CBS 271.37 TaxID=1442368 RepID=A0A0D2DYD4_9EURO|nr:uncharacterized protein Z517_02064 [Fonsecaea pedrosoi CBS 271.37]KIW82821.1 hypothetical protein Z517_02064 [Fonsecaea pedrosoi CBS 271.37]